MVVAGSDKKYWWKCDKGDDHEWKALVYNRTIGSGCPFCTVYPRSRIELNIAFELLHFVHFNVEDHKIQTSDGVWDIDIIIRDHNLIVEYDGAYWHRDKVQQDQEKTERLQSLGLHVLRIRESPLEPITPFDIQVPFGAKPKYISNRVLDHIVKTFDIPIPGLAEYKKRPSLINAKTAEEYIESLLMKQIPDAQMRLNLAND
jgi:hypothetical protein